MKTFLKYTLYLLLLAFVACSSEEDATPTGSNGQAQPGDALELTVSAADFVTDGALDTRATDSGTTTTFEDDDRVGVIVLDGTGELLYNNIPYEYNSNSNQWMFDSDNDEGKDGCYYDSEARTYIVYYPYSPAADGVRNIDKLKSIFPPKTNQSTEQDYRASDLMVWSETYQIPRKSVNIFLKHVYASVSLSHIARYVLDDGMKTECIPSFLKISDVNITINDAFYIPYKQEDGSLSCILPVGHTIGDVRCFYTIGSDITYSYTINISKTTENTRYSSALAIFDETYDLDDARVGDFYCRNSNDKGYLIPGDATLSVSQKGACIGIVIKVGKDDEGSWKDDCVYKFKGTSDRMTTIHGYVLALYDAINYCEWGSEGTMVGTNGERERGFYGYSNTQAIISYNKTNNKTLLSDFPATHYATAGYDSSHPAPVNSSGWFLPSGGQCQYWLNDKNGENKLLAQIRKATGDNSFNWTGRTYWSSSENGRKYAWFLNFDFDNHVGMTNKNFYDSVRSWLVF